MNLHYGIEGLIVGFAIAAPVGPISILIIKRSMVQGRLFGFISGLGAATADAIYGFIGGFGLTVLTNFLIEQRFWLNLIGGCFLCYLGYRTLRSKPKEIVTGVKGDSLLKAYTSILFLTITNPMTILSFVGIFAGLGLANGQSDPLSLFFLVLGVFVGSFLWWGLLSSVSSLFRNKLNLKSLIWVNRISGLIVLGFGVIAIIGLIL